MPLAVVEHSSEVLALVDAQASPSAGSVHIRCSWLVVEAYDTHVGDWSQTVAQHIHEPFPSVQAARSPRVHFALTSCTSSVAHDDGLVEIPVVSSSGPWKGCHIRFAVDIHVPGWANTSAFDRYTVAVSACRFH
jgi:hypothetical protein